MIRQFISVAILLQYYLRHKSYLKLSVKNVRLKSWLAKPIFKVGVSIFAINLFQSLPLSAANIIAAPYGDNTIAALGIVNRVISFRRYCSFTDPDYVCQHFVFHIWLSSDGYRSRAGFLFSISRQGIIYIPALWLLQQILEKNGIYYAPAAAEAITTLSVILFLCATKEQRKSLPKN